MVYVYNVILNSEHAILELKLGCLKLYKINITILTSELENNFNIIIPAL